MSANRYEQYLGDAVYASFDGYHIWLTTKGGNNNQIALEPPVYAALVKYVEWLKKNDVVSVSPWAWLKPVSARQVAGAQTTAVRHSQPCYWGPWKYPSGHRARPGLLRRLLAWMRRP